MLNGIGQGSTEGGTEVNEIVKVIANGSLNLRSGPGTSYSIIKSVAQGTIVTRIRKSVANANGYVWDKIRLNDGTEGYVATNYLEYCQSDKIDYSANGYNFIKDRDYTEVKAETQKTIAEGEREYNQMSYQDKEDNKDKLNKTYNILSGLCLTGIVLPHAGPALNRYKDNAGENLVHENGSNMINVSQNLRTEIEK